MMLRTFLVDALQVQVYANAEGLAQAATQQIVSQLQQRLKHQATATIVFATGRSQLGILSHLRTCKTIDWSRVIGFHLDEFLGLGCEHPASFSYYLHQYIAQWLPFQSFNYLNGNALDLMAECDRYTQLLQQTPIDICLLGIGNNGHLAFNDPAVANFNDPHWVKVVKLDAINRRQQLTAPSFSQLKDIPTHGITLSLSAIRSARHRLCCVFGTHKAKILKTLLTVSPSSQCPASMLRIDSNSTNSLFTDRLAYPVGMTSESAAQ